MIEQSTAGSPPPARVHALCAPTGWLLEACCRLDTLHPGFLRKATEASPAWRNAVALVIACGDDQRFQHVAASFMSMKAVEIIATTFGACPDGLVGAMAKLGHQEISPEALLALHAVFVDPQHARRRKVIRQLERLDERLLEAAMILDEHLVSPKLVLKVRHGRGAERFNRSIEVLRRHVSTATHTALANSLSALGDTKNIADWMRGWLRGADINLPTPPWRGGEGLIHLRDGESLRMASRRTNTCIEGRIDLVISGRATYYLEPKQGLIACVVMTTTGWLATQVVGCRNLRVPPPVRDEVLNTLERNGVPVFRPMPDTDGISAATSGYLRGRLGEFDLDEVLEDYEFA
jgi:hypothetical protein